MMTRPSLPNFRLWLIGGVMALLFLTLFASAFFVLHAGTGPSFAVGLLADLSKPASPPCMKNGCDNVDPKGLCAVVNSVDAENECLTEYPFAGSYNPASDSCAGSYSGHANLVAAQGANTQKATITSDGKPGGEQLASLQLIYSQTCGTNWLEILPLGRCQPTNSHFLGACSFKGWMQRTSRDTRDGDATPVHLLPTSPAGTTYSAMLWAPDVAIQGCVTASYPTTTGHQITDVLTTPPACAIQVGY